MSLARSEMVSENKAADRDVVDRCDLSDGSLSSSSSAAAAAAATAVISHDNNEVAFAGGVQRHITRQRKQQMLNVKQLDLYSAIL